jgi:hypothetical protein
VPIGTLPLFCLRQVSAWHNGIYSHVNNSEIHGFRSCNTNVTKIVSIVKKGFIQGGLVMDGDQNSTLKHTALKKVLSGLKDHPWAILTISLLVIVFAAFAITSTQQSGNSVTHSSASTASPGMSSAQSAADTSSIAGAAAIAKTNSTAATRMIIEQASLGVIVQNIHSTADKVEKMTADDGGFVQSLTESSTESGSSVMNLTLRVPETDFESFLSAARGVGTVKSFSQTGQDVTQQYQDLEDNLAELESESTAYTRLYNKAQSMQDMLQIQKALSQVNSQIADIQTQQHSLSRAVHLATVNLTLTTAEMGTVTRSPIIHALTQSLFAVKSSALALITLVAWLLPWGVLVTLIWVGVRWRRHRKTKT